MAFVGEAMKDMLVQKAYGNLKKRGYSYPLSTCYYVLLGILDREGEEAWNTEKSPTTCNGEVFAPFETFAPTVLFENIENEKIYYWSNIKKGIAELEV